MNQSKRWPHRPYWGRCVPTSFLLAILLLPGAALGQRVRPAAPASGAALLEGVVVAPQHGLAYVMRRGGGIDAVELASGAVRWHSDGGAKPLALAGDRLVAQAESRGANALDLAILDARSGAVRDSVRMPLPAGITATVVDTPAGAFRVRADHAGSQLAVRWESTSLTSGGPAQGYLPADNEGQAPMVVAGGAVIDLGASSLKVETEQPVRSVRSPALARPGLQELQAPLVKGAEGRQLLSADGRHVLVTEPVSTTEFTLYRHRWTVYDRASGARLGSAPALVSATPFLVVGTTLFHTAPAHVLVEEGRIADHPASLRAVDLKTGTEVWTMAVQETAFKGPFPP